MQRCVAFLVDELKVCTRAEAEEHVFFVSAREALAMRSKSGNSLHNGPPGSVNNLGSPLPAGKLSVFFTILLIILVLLSTRPTCLLFLCCFDQWLITFFLSYPDLSMVRSLPRWVPY